ncbi:unnamed protein product [Toxocara canis]|nr:unnamed protein product [Toxocara canis]
MGSSMIALFSLLGLSINLAYRIGVDNSTISGIAPLVVGTLAVIALAIGLRTRSQLLLLPFLAVQALGIAAVFALLILCLISLFIVSNPPEVTSEADISTVASKQDRSDDSVSTSLTMAMLLGELILQLWFMNTVWRCFGYFKALKRHNAMLNVSSDV